MSTTRVQVWLGVGLLVWALGWPFAQAGPWPHWRGEQRSGVVAEDSGFDKGVWPLQRPVWKATVGLGASSPLVVDGSLYTLGWEDGSDVVRCLDAEDGSERWVQRYPSPRYGRHARGDQGLYRGATVTPEYDPETGLLFTLSCDGRLSCWNTREGGAPVWDLNFYDRYGVPQRPQITEKRNTRRDYGYTCAPLVIGDWVIAEVGDPESGNLMAFDKRSGELRWTSENRDTAGHSGGMALMNVDGVPCVAVATAFGVHVARLDEANAGRTVAAFPWRTDFANTIAGVATEGSALLITSRYNQSAMVRLDVSLAGGARERWRSPEPSGVCTPVIAGGRIYVANKGVRCLDFETGRKLWEGGRIGDAGSCVMTADGRLIVWGNGGDLLLVEGADRSPDRYVALAEQERLFKDMAWPHVVVAEGRLFAKVLGGGLLAYSLTDTPAVTATPSSPPASSTPAAAGQPAPLGDAALPNWPGSRTGNEGLLYAWKRGFGPGRSLGALMRSRLEAQGGATLGAGGEMNVKEGAYRVLGLDGPLLEACRKSSELTLEAVLRSPDLEQRGPARILTFSDGGHARNFTLGQERERFVLRLRTPDTGENGSSPESTFGQVQAGAWQHVLVSYKSGDLRAWVNGEEVLRSDRVAGDFSNWAEMTFLVGDEWEDRRNWAGEIAAFAVFNRAMNEEEANERFALALPALP